MTYSIKDLMTSSVRNFWKNKYAYLLSVVLLQLFLSSIGRYSLALCFRMVLRLAGVSNLTKDNFLSVINQTVPFLLLILYILMVAGFIFFEMICLVYIVTRSQGQFSFKGLLAKSLQNLKWLAGPQMSVFVLYLLLLIPLGKIGLMPTLLERFRIPDFISGELTKTHSGTWLYGMTLMVICYLNMRLIFFLPLSVLNGHSPWQNMKESWSLTRTQKRKWLGTILSIYLVVGVIWGCVAFPLTILFELLDSQWDNVVLQSLFYSLMRLSYVVVGLVNKLMTAEVLVQWLLKQDQVNPKVSYIDISETSDKPLSYPRWTRFFLVLGLLYYVILNAVQLYLVGLNPNTLMIAHRGDVSEGVENSIEALEAAHKKGANLVEMDVVMTADQQFVVIHDNELKRLTGIGWKVSEKTLAELEGLRIYQGSFDGQIVSLDTYFERAKALNQSLLIELKPYGHEPKNYVSLVLAKLRELGLRSTDKVMSLDLKVMEELEATAPEISTGYVIPLQFGTFDQHEIDFYVLEDFSYNDMTMLSAEKSGKDVYVWTINDETTMANYLQSPVNGIITDELELFQSEKTEMSADGSYFARALRLLATQEK